ncbi:MAG: hypothetical protein PHU03_07975 [Syntrophales bacterium]|nr:hypothetical protein [Syntrophales bacterium]
MKTVKQIGHFLKNEPGSLSEVSDLLGANGINILAIYFKAEGKEGWLQYVPNDPERTVNVMKSAGYEVEVTDVLACVVPHHPGGLNAVLKPLKNAGINVENIYACFGTIGSVTVAILGVENVMEAARILSNNWIRLLGEELYNM